MVGVAAMVVSSISESSLFERASSYSLKGENR